MRRTIFDREHNAFREQIVSFLRDEVVPDYPSWERTALPPRWFWRRLGDLGVLGICAPQEHGGTANTTFVHSVVVTEEAQRAGLALGGVRVHTDICMPYLIEYATPDQRARWLPRLTSGEAVIALAMSEPGAGSDVKAMSTRARPDGDDYVIDGAKTFISNGLGADLVIVAAKTDPDAGRRGITLFVVEARCRGFARGRSLEKLGLKAQDLSELFFTDMRVPAVNVLGELNHGFEYLTANLAQERLSIAVNSQAHAAATLDHTIEMLRLRGSRVGQTAKFELAACAAEVAAGQAFVDNAVGAHLQGDLKPDDAAAVKLFCTELQCRVVDRCLQVVGPEAYVRTHPLGRAYADARVSRIYGGSSEIMKVIVAKELGL